MKKWGPAQIRWDSEGLPWLQKQLLQQWSTFTNFTSPHKLLALEYAVPNKVKKTLSHGLQNMLQDVGHRITRLEEEFRGSEQQVQYLVEMLDKARRWSSRILYTELRELVRGQSAFGPYRNQGRRC